MKRIESVTGLVNCLFSAYDKPIHGLDWEEKINEYADVINDYIGLDTDLTELYKDIRGNFASLPQPSAIKKMLSKSRTREEVRQQVEHPDNGKLIVITCYKNNEITEIRDYVVHNTEYTKSLTDTTKDLREKFDNIKVYEYCQGSTLMSRKRLIPIKFDELGEPAEFKAEWEATVYIPNGYDAKGYVTEYKKQRIA